MEDKIVKILKNGKYGILVTQSKQYINLPQKSLNLVYLEDGSLIAVGDDEIELIWTDKEE